MSQPLTSHHLDAAREADIAVQLHRLHTRQLLLRRMCMHLLRQRLRLGERQALQRPHHQPRQRCLQLPVSQLPSSFPACLPSGRQLPRSRPARRPSRRQPDLHVQPPAQQARPERQPAWRPGPAVAVAASLSTAATSSGATAAAGVGPCLQGGTQLCQPRHGGGGSDCGGGTAVPPGRGGCCLRWG